MHTTVFILTEFKLKKQLLYAGYVKFEGYNFKDLQLRHVLILYSKIIVLIQLLPICIFYLCTKFYIPDYLKKDLALTPNC